MSSQVFCRTNCVHVQVLKENDKNCYECLRSKACCNVLNVFFRDQRLTLKLFSGHGSFLLGKRRMVTTKRKHCPACYQTIGANHTQSHRICDEKSLQDIIFGSIMSCRPLICWSSQGTYHFSSQIEQHQSTVEQHVFLDSNDGFQRTVTLGHQSVKLTVNELVHDMPNLTKVIFNACWELNFVTKIINFTLSFGPNLNHSRPAMVMWIAGNCFVKWWSAPDRFKRLTAITLGRQRIPTRKTLNGCGCCH